jgi:hypothetical protein
LLGLDRQERKAIRPTPSTSSVGIKISRIPPTQKSPGRSTEQRLLSSAVPIDDMRTPSKLNRRTALSDDGRIEALSSSRN